MGGESEVIIAINHADTLKWIIGGLIGLLMVFVGYIWKKKDSVDEELKHDIKALLSIVPKIENIENKVGALEEDFKEHQKDYFRMKDKLIELWTIYKTNK